MRDSDATSTPPQDSRDPPAPIFHDKFNFEDGNIIIAASGTLPKTYWLEESKVGTRYFRVHKSILKLHSTTFADLFTFPQPDPSAGGDQETIDSIPVVHLHDALSDLIKLMTVMYYGDAVPQVPLLGNTFDFLAPVVLLADKYGMDTVVDKYLPRVRADWPISLEKWDHIEGQIKLYITYQQTLNEPERADNYFVEPCGAISFARAQGIDSILPSAFYHLSRVSPKFDHGDDDDDRSWDYRFEGGRTAAWSLLSTKDYRTLQIGQHAIRAWVIDEARGYRHQISHEGEEACQQAWWSMVMMPRMLDILYGEEIDVLARLAEMDGQLDTEQLCQACRFKASGIPKLLREAFWQKLPDFFGLEVGVG